MDFSKVDKGIGLPVEMLRTDKRHFDIKGNAGAASGEQSSFQSSLIGALNEVNDQQMGTGELAQKMITAPDEVDVHDVTIAMAKANMTLSLTKQIVDGAIKAYREITSLR